MPRSPRYYVPGLIYHAYTRGNNRELIFFEESNYQRFLSNLERYRIPLNYKIFAYCFLPNHFHLLLQINNVSISKIMQILLTAYTMYINKKYARVGHIFQGRYQSIIVEKDTYLLQVQRYIHLNPVKAGLVLEPDDYLWSSYNSFLGNTGSPIGININDILDMFSENKLKQKYLFQEFTKAGYNDEFDPSIKQVRGILGSSKFNQRLTKVLKGVRP